MLSKKTKYAIKALLYLAKNYGEGPVLIGTLSEKEKIPKKFLESILLDLRKQGILASKMGIGGGYYLLKKPNEVFLSQIIRVTDGPIALVPCVSLNFYEKCDDCEHETICCIKDVMTDVREATLKILSTTTLEDMLKRESKLSKLVESTKSKK